MTRYQIAAEQLHALANAQTTLERTPLERDIEEILFRRVATNRLDGYTVETAREIMGLIARSPAIAGVAARETNDKIGKWLSAALDDPAVCAAMKADINDWFGAAHEQTHMPGRGRSHD